MEFITAVKDRVVGAVSENVGYYTGNQEMEQKGREQRDTASDHAKDFYEDAGNVKNTPIDSSQENLSAVAALRDAHHDAILNQNNDTSSTSFNPSLFSRNQPDPETSAHGAVKDQQHADTIPHWEPVSRDVTDKPAVFPIKTDGISALPDSRDQWSNQSSQSSSDESGSKWMDKLGSIMSGTNKDEAQSFWRTENTHEEVKDDQSVMDKLRDAHSEAVASPQQKSMTETVKEKFDSWNNSNASSERSSNGNWQENMNDMKDSVQDRVVDMKDNVQEKVGDMKDQVDSMWNKSASSSHSIDPLPVKHDATADIPDPNFIQNA